MIRQCRGEVRARVTALAVVVAAVAVGAFCVAGLAASSVAHAQASGAGAADKPAELQITGAPMPMRVLVQSPAETATELQTICLFAATPENTLHGSLVELNEKLKGLLEKIRKPGLFRGDLGETLVLTAPAGGSAGRFGAKRLLLIGLGDSATFTPERMEFVGATFYREAARLGVTDPYFAPTILDGGVTKFATGDVAENFVAGFLRAARTEKLLQDAGAAQKPLVRSLTFLAGAAHAADTQHGIQRGLGRTGAE